MSYIRVRPNNIVGAPDIRRGARFTRIGRDKLFFEAEFFKYAAAPQYLIRYWLQNNSPKWACSCPDFLFRRRGSETLCKHCQAAAHLSRGEITPFINAHMCIISENEYNLLAGIPIGAPLPLFGRGRFRIDISPEPGYISWNREWKCYTCGGPSGNVYIKNKQCKHIACYSQSLIDNRYQPFCTPVSRSVFNAAVTAQRNAGMAAWRRF
jgi:predicted nucleic acid-binding Zn finger protein